MAFDISKIISLISKLTEIQENFKGTTTKEKLNDYVVQELIEKALDLYINVNECSIADNRVSQETKNEYIKYNKIVSEFQAKFARFHGDKV